MFTKLVRCEQIRDNIFDKCLLVLDKGLRLPCYFKSIVGELRNSDLKSPKSLREFSPRLTLCVEEIHVTQLISQSAYNLKPLNILKRSGMKVQERNSVRRSVRHSEEQGERTNESHRLSSDESFRKLCSN